MSRSVDLFIDLALPIDEVADRIRSLTSLSLQPGQVPGTWSLEEGEVHAELHAHPYIDDGDLLLGQYGWALTCRVAAGVRMSDAPETTLLRLVSEALQRGGVPCLLVHDLQYRDRATAAATTVAAADADPPDGAG